MPVYPSDIGDFVIGRSPIGVPLAFLPTFAQSIIPSYAYVEYQDDDAVLAFVEAYNIYAQAYLDYINNLNLPIYTQLNGLLLDWVARGLYGIYRPSLAAGAGTPPEGPFATTTFASITFAGYEAGFSPSLVATSDDVFKRIITWFFYKGDGKVFTPKWLKRRINRFLFGLNGEDIANDTTYKVSLNWTGAKAWTITLATTTMSTIFNEAVQAGAIELPFQIDWTIVLT